MTIHSFKLLNNDLRVQPKLNFRGKNISRLDQFKSRGITLDWVGTPQVVENGVRIPPSAGAKFDFDFSAWEEFTMCYTFQLHARDTWKVLLNLASNNTSTFGFKLEHGTIDSERLYLDGITNSGGGLIGQGNSRAPSTPIDLNRVCNMLVVVSKVDPACVYLNGIKIMTFNQPDDNKGWNGKRHTNIRSNSFNIRFNNERQGGMDATHYSLRIWDKALKTRQLMQEMEADIRDYNVDIRQSVVNRFKANEYKVGE